MTTRERILGTAVRAGAFLTGLAIVAVVVWSWRVPGGSGTVGATVSMQVQPLGELAVSPLEPVLIGDDLQPGAEPSTGALTVQNQTGAELAVGVRATPTGPELDRLLWVEVAAEDGTVFRGPLRGLRRWTPAGFGMTPGATARLTVSAWVPEDAGSGFEGRAETLQLELQPRPVGG